MKFNPSNQKIRPALWSLFAALIVSGLALAGCQTAVTYPEFFVEAIENSTSTTGSSEQLGRTLSSSKMLDAELRVLIAAHELTGDPSLGRDLPSIHTPIAQLGKKLFFTKALGGDMDVACVSCHHPQLGGGDGLSLSIGVGAHNPDLLGPGRTHPEGTANVPRNAPTTFNIGLWDKVLFWDGRVESLGKTPGMGGADEMGIRTPDVAFGMADPAAGDNLVIAQSRFPVTSMEEMRGHTFESEGNNADVRNRLAQRLSGYGTGLAAEQFESSIQWLAQFEVVFGPVASNERLINEQRIARAIAAYEQSQTFVDNPWKAYVQGDEQAISDSAKRGAQLFFSSKEAGGANCASCHMGDFFTDEQFHTIAIPQVGPGKELTVEGADFGRFRETQDPNDLYAFRTPTLLNVEVTGPYGHSGAYTTLEGIIRHHLNPVEGCVTYDIEQLDPMIQTDNSLVNTEEVMVTLLEKRDNGMPTIEDISLDDAQVDDLVSFLHALTDQCVTDAVCLEPWLPFPGEDNFDTNQLMAQIPAVEQ